MHVALCCTYLCLRFRSQVPEELPIFSIIFVTDTSKSEKNIASFNPILSNYFSQSDLTKTILFLLSNQGHTSQIHRQLKFMNGRNPLAIITFPQYVTFINAQ